MTQRLMQSLEDELRANLLHQEMLRFKLQDSMDHLNRSQFMLRMVRENEELRFMYENPGHPVLQRTKKSLQQPTQ